MREPSPERILDPNRREFLGIAAAGVLGSYWAPAAKVFANAVGAGKTAAEKELIVRSASPFNGEPALEHLAESWITPVKHFYVRNHAPTPKLDGETFRVSVEGLVDKPSQLSLAELKGRFRSISALATLTCAGNRRNEHSRIKKVSGVQWDAGAIGNARWTGVPLSEVLKASGVKEGAKHVWFESVDRIERDGKVIPFGGSIPLKKALDDAGGVPGALVAFDMNGEPLPPDHGYPLRVVVPGHIGARSVKWLGKVVVSDRPSPNHYLAGAYKLVTEPGEHALETASPIYRFPTNSAICTPAPGTKLGSGNVRVAGYALPAGKTGNKIARVEVSLDGGKTWANATLEDESHAFCWRLWHAEVRVDRRTTALLARAVDTTGNVQPETVPWNLKGYLFNAWHRVPVEVS